MDSRTSFHTCKREDLDALVSLGIETYRGTFDGMTSARVMDEYLETAFDSGKVGRELSDSNSQFLFLEVAGKIAGYLKVNENGAQTDLRGPDGLEIERIFLRKGFQGQGFGRVLLEKALEIAGQKGKRYAWLGVWEKNTAAIRFYERMGFEKAGTHDFFMARERQTDWIMKRAVERGE
jgi:diamine N-acetyltransferase